MKESQEQLKTYLYPQLCRNRRPRKMRTIFTNEQLESLEVEYQANEYITPGIRFRLAKILDLNENQIKVWFQNRRAKERRIKNAIEEQRRRFLLL